LARRVRRAAFPPSFTPSSFLESDTPVVLIVGSSSARRPPTITVDEYVPLDLQWEPGESAPLYWEAGGAHSAMEIGADPNTGEILSMTVVYAGAPVLQPGIAERECSKTERDRHPVCDLSPWKGRGTYVHAPDTFELTLYTDSLRISLGRGECVRSLVSGPVRFDLGAAGELLGISVTGLSEGQRRQVIETVDRQDANAGLPVAGTGAQRPTQ
jgi:hypothetical protein